MDRQYNGLVARLDKQRAQLGDPMEAGKRYKCAKERYSTVTKEIEQHGNLLMVRIESSNFLTVTGKQDCN